MKVKLTQEEKKIIKEIKEISKKAGFDLSDLDEYSNEDREFHLNWVKKLMVVSTIITDYTFFDSILSRCILDYYFGKNNMTHRFWKTKKFNNFNYYILEKLYFLNKFDLFKNIKKVSKEIGENIHKLNDLRNGLVHSFYPQNLRVDKSLYDGESIFSIKGFRKYEKDMNKIRNFLVKKIK